MYDIEDQRLISADRIKHFAVIRIPLIYYIYPFQGYFGDALSPLLISHDLDLTQHGVKLFL